MRVTLLAIAVVAQAGCSVIFDAGSDYQFDDDPGPGPSPLACPLGSFDAELQELEANGYDDCYFQEADLPRQVSVSDSNLFYTEGSFDGAEVMVATRLGSDWIDGVRALNFTPYLYELRGRLDPERDRLYFHGTDELGTGQTYSATWDGEVYLEDDQLEPPELQEISGYQLLDRPLRLSANEQVVFAESHDGGLARYLCTPGGCKPEPTGDLASDVFDAQGVNPNLVVFEDLNAGGIAAREVTSDGVIAVDVVSDPNAIGMGDTTVSSPWLSEDGCTLYLSVEAGGVQAICRLRRQQPGDSG